MTSWTTPTQVADNVAWPASEINAEVIDDLIHLWENLGPVGYGTYTGDGNDDRSISGLDFDPEVVIVVRDGGASPALTVRTASMSGDDAWHITPAAAGSEANYIQSLDTKAFEIGTDVDINNNGDPYYYVYWRTDGDTI